MSMMKRLTIPLVAALLAGQSASATAQPPSSGPVHRINVSAPGALDVLPTLKARMARLGTLMNFLFRNIDETAKAPELIAATREMEEHLRYAGDFKPTSIAILGNTEREAKGMKQFTACLEKARRGLAELRNALDAGAADEPRRALLRLDRTRRDCHAAFG